MLRRLVRDESGITMVLAMIMVLLIGVMGAGLLVFVQTGLNTALRVNQGQRAFDMADAGVQAAKRQLKINAAITQFDGVTNTTATPPNLESEWSYAGAGKTLSLGGCTSCINVKIQYLRRSSNSLEVRNPDHAPEVTDSRDYFKVISEGTTGGARRKIEAIYFVEGSDVPRAFLAKGDVTISGTSELTNMSIFTQGTATINGRATFTGTDLTYGDWNKPPYNTTPRGTTTPGVGAEGNITGGVTGRDYGANTSPQFIRKTPPDLPNPSGKISYPFDYRIEPDLEDLRLAAQQQDNYYPKSSVNISTGRAYDITEPTGTGEIKWPDNSTVETVVFVRFPSYSNQNKVNWRVSGPGDCSDAPPRKGTLVVQNGEFVMGQNTARLNGVVIVRGVPVTSDSFTQGGGRTCLEGPANTSGRITIAGKVRPFTLEKGNRPGFYAVRLRSWRELYQ